MPDEAAKSLIRVLFLLALQVTLTPSALACVNDYVPNHKAIAASRSLAEELTKEELIEPWATRRDRLRKEVQAGGDYKVRNDLASALMHTGDAQTAIQILEEIEKSEPGLYQTASNLGTAYELAGKNENALEWIRKGIERNPKSHDSSEWIHVKILEAKIAQDKNTDLPADGSILGLHFDFSSRPKQPPTLPAGNSGEVLTMDQIEAGLKYQLHERLQFVKAPDLIVASLLLDLGNIIALKSGSHGAAQGIYEFASSYMPPDQEDTLLKGRILHCQKLAHLANMKHSFFADPVQFTVSMAILGVIALYVLLKIRDYRRKCMARNP